MSLMNSHLTFLLVICFISLLEVEGQLPDIQFRDGVDSEVQTCSEGTTCTLMTKCATAFSSGDRKQFPRICKWDNSDPWVCCPTPNKLISKPLTEFPENECAGPHLISVSNDPVLLRVKRLLPVNIFAVVGGKDVESINSFPFVAAIYQMAGKEKVFLCGGTLLSKDVILTAAHCFLAKDESSKYMVQLGLANFDAGGNSSDLKEFQVTSVKVHEEFKYPQLYNDIALVKFQGLSSFSEETRPVCLLDASKDDTAQPEVIVLGWGSKQSGGSLSSILQEAQLEVIPNAECNSTLAKLGALGVNFPLGITNKIVCAGGSKNVSKDACQGDSGGPLVALIDGKWRQRGIVSGGIGCGVPGNPGIYTRVSEYVTWIQENS